MATASPAPLGLTGRRVKDFPAGGGWGHGGAEGRVVWAGPRASGADWLTARAVGAIYGCSTQLTQLGVLHVWPFRGLLRGPETGSQARGEQRPWPVARAGETAGGHLQAAPPARGSSCRGASPYGGRLRGGVVSAEAASEPFDLCWGLGLSSGPLSPCPPTPRRSLVSGPSSLRNLS